MKNIRKRKYLINETDKKIWKGPNEIILGYLKNNENCKFGDIMNYVNSELGKGNEYSRKGLHKKLSMLIDKGNIGRRPHKQGHYFYYLTKKGGRNIELISNTYQQFAWKLLKDHFVKKRTKIQNKGHFVERIVERMGVYMLFSCIDGIAMYTSPKQKFEDNIGNIQMWANGINPAMALFLYLDDFPRNFIKFDSVEDQYCSSTLQNKSLIDFLKELEKILSKKYPEEYKSLVDYKKYIAYDIHHNKQNKMTPLQYKKEKIRSVRWFMEESEKIFN